MEPWPRGVLDGTIGSKLEQLRKGLTVAVRYGWSLATEDWATFQNANPGVKDPSWHRVNLRLLDRDSVPAGPGIYMLCAHPSTKYALVPPHLYDAIYVGRATSLRNRFVQHCGVSSPRIEQAKTCFKSPLHYWYLETPNFSVLESLLILCLGPSANQIEGTIPATIGLGRPAGI